MIHTFIRMASDLIFLTTTVFRFAKEKELASLKQLFLFNATLHTYALRQKNAVLIFSFWYFFFCIKAKGKST